MSNIIAVNLPELLEIAFLLWVQQEAWVATYQFDSLDDFSEFAQKIHKSYQNMLEYDCVSDFVDSEIKYEIHDIYEDIMFQKSWRES